VLVRFVSCYKVAFSCCSFTQLNINSVFSCGAPPTLLNAIQAKGAQRDSEQDAELLIVRAAQSTRAEVAAKAFVAATNMEYDKLVRSRMGFGLGWNGIELNGLRAARGGGTGRYCWMVPGMQSIVKWGAGQVLHKNRATKKRRRTLPTHVRCGCI